MLPLIRTLIAAGMAAPEILNFISKKVKGVEKGVKSARGYGHSDNDILNFLSGTLPQFKTKQAKQSQSDTEKYLSKAGLKTQDERKESRQRGLRNTLAAGGAALGAYNLYNKYKGLLGTVGAVIPEVLPPESGPTQPLQIGNQASPQIPWSPDRMKGPQGPNQFQMPAPMNPSAPPPIQMIKGAKQPGVPAQEAQNIAGSQVPVQQPQPVQAEAPQPPVVPPQSPTDVLKQQKLDTLIQSMSSAGHKPEEIVEYVQESHPEYAKNIEGLTKEPLLNSVYRFLGKKMKKPKLGEQIQTQFQQQYGSQNEQPPTDQTEPPQIEGAGNQPQLSGQGEVPEKGIEADEAPKEKGKGDVVALPSGEIGTIEDIKKDHAVVEVDGKKKPVKLDDLDVVPISKKDLADTHEDLIKSMEEETGEEVSRAVMWAGYDPKTNQLKYLPWDGPLYTYDDIDEKTAKELKTLLLRKTSGESLVGPWVEGTKSVMGSRMSELIKKLQEERGGKGQEYSGKAQALYSAYEPALKAAKAKKKARKDEEKRRKKEQG